MKNNSILKRIAQMMIILLGVSFFSFLLIHLAPGDAVRSMFLANGIQPTQAQIDQARAEVGLDQPFAVQYKNWLLNCLKGDFGRSYTLRKPVSALLMSRLMPTIKLAGLSMVLMLVVAIPMGMLSALYKDRLIDHIIRGATFFGVSMPNFWVGLLLLYVIALKWKLLPVVSSGTGLNKMILPAVTLAFAMSAKYTRQVRATILEELGQDYVVGARARGIKEREILWKHIFPNSLLPLVTLLGLSLGSLLGGTAVVEVIFSYQGLGNLAVSAISGMDYPLIQGYVLWIALIYMVINWIVDISYGYLDPRIREGGRTGE